MKLTHLLENRVEKTGESVGGERKRTSPVALWQYVSNALEITVAVLNFGEL